MWFDAGVSITTARRTASAAATVADWDVDRLGAMHEALRAHPSPRMVLVGASFDEGSVVLMDFLFSHGIEVSGYAVEVAKRGSERLMSVSQCYPAARDGVAEPEFVVAVEEPVQSAPPPPPPPPVEAPTA